MRLFIAMLAAALVLLTGQAALAEEIAFTGKTVSPNHTEIFSPHATPEEVAAFKAASGEDQGPDSPFAPFTGKMTVTKLLTGIGQNVNADQKLLEFVYPREGLAAWRGRLSQSDVAALEAQLGKARSKEALLRASLTEARKLRERGIASGEAVSELARQLQVAALQEAVLADKMGLARGMAEGELDEARKRFGKNVDKGLLTGTSWIVAPEPGTVLWVNPDLQPGMILTARTRLFVVGSLDPLLVRAWVYESQATRLRVGDKAQISFESLSGKTVSGAVSRVSMSPVYGDPQMPSEFEVDLTLQNPGLVLKEGLRGAVTVQVPDGPR